jgi:hypothetical protein
VNELLKALMQHNGYMAPVGDDGELPGGATDRGDSVAAAAAADEDAAPAQTASAEEPEEGAKAAATEGDGEDDRVRDEKGRFIPKERFDEAVKKERGEKELLAARLKEYEDREAQSRVSADFAEAQKAVKDMIKQHSSLLADGEIDKAADLMGQILDLKEAISERKAESRAMTAKDQAKEEVQYAQTVERLETQYPSLNPDHDDYDRTATRRVQAMMAGLMQTERMPAAKALREAVEIVMGKPAAPAAATDKAEEAGLRRKQAAVAKALDAKGKQPASTKDVGLDHDKEGGALDASAVMKMTWDEFVKLPDSKLSELRGDYI